MNTNMKNPIHFISGDYLAIKTETGRYMIRVGSDPAQSVQEFIHEMDAKILRFTRLKIAYSKFLEGQTVLDPSALRM